MQKKTKHQTFEVRTIHRSELLNAPYNPRKINDHQRKGLKKNLKKVGLLGPLIWNEPSKHIVSGHQRIDILDELEGTDDYYLDVSVVNLTDTVEKEQNVFLNSTTFTGEFDLSALREMVESGLDYSAAGLDLYDLNIIGVEKHYEAATQAPADAPHDEESEDTNDEPERSFEEKKALIKAEKARIQEHINTMADEGESYVTISFDSYKDKSGWMIKYGFAPADLFIRGEIFDKVVKQKIEDHA